MRRSGDSLGKGAKTNAENIAEVVSTELQSFHIGRCSSIHSSPVSDPWTSSKLRVSRCETISAMSSAPISALPLRPLGSR